MTNIINFQKEALKRREKNYNCKLDVHDEGENKIKRKDCEENLILDNGNSAFEDMCDSRSQQSYKSDNFEAGIIVKEKTDFYMVDEDGNMYYGPNSKNLNENMPFFNGVTKESLLKKSKTIALKSRYSMCAIAFIGITVSMIGAKSPKINNIDSRSIPAIASNVESSVSENVSRSFIEGVGGEVINPYKTFEVIKKYTEDDIVFDYVVEIALYEDAWTIKEEPDKLNIIFNKEKMDFSIGVVSPSEDSLQNNNREELEERAKNIRLKLIEQGVSYASVEDILKEQLPNLDLFKNKNLPVNVELIEGGN